MDDSEKESEKARMLAGVREGSWADLPTDQLFSVFLVFIFLVRTTKVFHPLCHDSVIMHIPHELCGVVPLSSREGWLLMSKGQWSIFLFNPVANAVIRLPDLPDDYHFQGMVFTACPTSSNCAVVGIRGDLDMDFSMSMIRRGEDRWKVSRVTNDLPSSLSRGNIVFHRGDFYCIGKDGNVVLINPNEANWRVVENPYRQPNAMLHIVSFWWNAKVSYF
ncbi:hypothetical protein Vadar_001280 [Vaccinium darrowii]|uniref:Uncharacterized protein n=1 Tax=Vaccinium darrowii TaxID=229202 RepID=A0ACB7Z1T3_9ERIC|nr:hypothetical protein Vadar_001280 [Vaccinium darrowii]